MMISGWCSTGLGCSSSGTFASFLHVRSREHRRWRGRGNAESHYRKGAPSERLYRFCAYFLQNVDDYDKLMVLSGTLNTKMQYLALLIVCIERSDISARSNIESMRLSESKKSV